MVEGDRWFKHGPEFPTPRAWYPASISGTAMARAYSARTRGEWRVRDVNDAPPHVEHGSRRRPAQRDGDQRGLEARRATPLTRSRAEATRKAQGSIASGLRRVSRSERVRI